MSNADFVTGFIDAWNALNVDNIMEHFTDDCVYVNVPIATPNNGKEEIRAFIEGFTADCSEINFTIHHQTISADGSVVMNERTDRLKMNGNWVEIAVMGVFEFRDGKICAWRDYFDMAALTAQ